MMVLQFSNESIALLPRWYWTSSISCSFLFSISNYSRAIIVLVFAPIRIFRSIFAKELGIIWRMKLNFTGLRLIVEDILNGTLPKKKVDVHFDTSTSVLRVKELVFDNFVIWK